MSQKERKPRYTIANIVTADEKMCVKSDEVRQMGFTHEDIYRAGLEQLSREKS